MAVYPFASVLSIVLPPRWDVARHHPSVKSFNYMESAKITVPGVRIRGNSVAAWCSMHLLAKAGFAPEMERTSRPRLPAIMLSEGALWLIRDVFDGPDLFRSSHRITKRVVQWGRGAEPMVFDHAANVVSERDLLSELEQVQEAGPAPGPQSAASFTIFASRPLPDGPIEHCFGSRTAFAAPVRLKDWRDSASCWIESLEDGWLFLIPNAAESGWLLSVGCSPQALGERSRLIGVRIASLGETAGEFSTSPRIVSPICGAGWLACGTAGMAFDPICGDGTAHAVREAILAAAVVKAISVGEDEAPLLRHYEARLVAGFQRHLMTSTDFYRLGNSGPWWDHELALAGRGLEWCASRANHLGPFRYRLSGFELLSIDKSPA